MVQQWRLCAYTARGKGSTPGQGTKIPQATWWGKKKKEPCHLGTSVTGFFHWVQGFQGPSRLQCVSAPVNVWLFVFISLAVPGLHCGTRASLLQLAGFSSCGTWDKLSFGMRDLISLTRDRIHIPSIARQSLNHWITRKDPVTVY